MSNDDVADIRAGLDCLRKAIRSIRTARRAIKNMRESSDKRDAEIDLTHAEQMTAIAERLFSSAVGKESQDACDTTGDPYDGATGKSDVEGE